MGPGFVDYRRTEVMPDLFEAFVHSVTGQQISTKACDTIWKRLKAKLCNITPETISEISAEEIKSCGMYLRKASYIKGIADNILSGKLDIHSLPALPDSDVLKALTGIKGQGFEFLGYHFEAGKRWVRKKSLKALDGFIRRRLRSMLRKQEKRPGMGYCRADHSRWPDIFFAKAGLFTLEETLLIASQPR